MLKKIIYIKILHIIFKNCLNHHKFDIYNSIIMNKTNGIMKRLLLNVSGKNFVTFQMMKTDNVSIEMFKTVCHLQTFEGKFFFLSLSHAYL